MRTLFLSVPLLATIALHAQDAALFIVPRWKVGDTRTLDIMQTAREEKDGTFSEERTEQHATVRVVNEDANAYILRVQCDNAIVGAFSKLGATAGADLDPYKQVMLRYAVSRRDGSSRLENWEEVQKHMRKSFDATMAGLQKQDSAAASAAGVLLLPILGVFKDRANVEAYFSEVIGYITFPFGKRLTDTDTLKATAYSANPFNPAGNDSIPMTTFTNVKRIDRLQQQAVVRREERSDFSAFVGMMKDMMRQMMDAAKMTPAERKKAEAKMEAELKNMRFDMDNEALYTVDLHTTWPLGVKATVHMNATNGTRSSVTTTITEVTVTP